MSEPRHVEQLRALKACKESIEWAATYPNLTAAWRECPHGDRMIWLVFRCSGKPGSASRRRALLALVDCLRLAGYDESGASTAALDIIEGYAMRVRGVTLDMVELAGMTAASAASAYSVTYAAYSASAAAIYASAQADIIRRHYPRPPALGRSL